MSYASDRTKDLEQARAGCSPKLLDHIDKDQTEIAQLELTLNELGSRAGAGSS